MGPYILKSDGTKVELFKVEGTSEELVGEVADREWDDFRYY